MRKIIDAQKEELNHYKTYKELAKVTNNENKKILERIAKEELNHYDIIKSKTSIDTKPSKIKVIFYYYISRIFGLSFGLKLMERNEKKDANLYRAFAKTDNRFKKLISQDKMHDNLINNKIHEEKLSYASSIILGLNDALVELTGALAGLTLALQNGSIIGVTGLITGIAAALSMSASGYLSSKEENNINKKPLKSAIYTGIAYIITVILLVMPYFIFSNVFISLFVMILTGLLVIFIYTFYISVAKSIKLWPKFREMIIISLSVTTISFLIGLLVNYFFGISV